jgi:RHS repeat-associated protein
LNGAAVERYQYSAYGEPTFLTEAFAAGTASSYEVETLYCGYRCDVALGLYLARNRALWPHLGRWNRRDPIGYSSHDVSLYRYVTGNPAGLVDPSGLQDYSVSTETNGCTITIYAGHNFEDIGAIKSDFPQIDSGGNTVVPPNQFIIAIGCGVTGPNGKRCSLQKYLQTYYPNNTVNVPGLPYYNSGDIPFAKSPGYVQSALTAARAAAGRLCSGQQANPKGKACPPKCDTVTIQVKCDNIVASLSSSCGTFETTACNAP